VSDKLGTEELLALLGEAAFIALAEAFGGRRILVPANIKAEHEIALAIGPEAAERLSRQIAPDVIRVPLARDLRARHYRNAGMSYGRIATMLGMTETSVQKMFIRLAKPATPAKPRPDFPRRAPAEQLPLFPDDTAKTA
jgi:hypothetical protein